jgi:ABC-2 type transport system permease protein
MRYLRLYLCFVRFSVSRALEFRLDFFFRIVMDIAYYGVNIALFETLFHHTAEIGGWNIHETRAFMAGFLVIDAISMTVFSNNFHWLPTFINRGDLDYYLVRPVSSLFFLSLRDFAANSFVNLLCALGILAWALAGNPDPLSPWQLLLFGAALLGGALLHALLHMLTILPSFWLESSEGLHTLFYTLGRLMERPDRIFTGATRVVLTTVLPFCLIASFPARFLWEGWDIQLALHFLLVLAAFSGLVLWLWHLGLRRYGSASS